MYIPNSILRVKRYFHRESSWYDECIANSILQDCFRKDIVVRPMKLQKLLYYVVGFYYKYRNEYVPQDDFYKWDYGPVIPAVYKSFKKYKYQPITSLYKDPKTQRSYVAGFDEDFDGILRLVIDYYGGFNDIALSDFTHKHEAWSNCNHYEKISRESIKHTFDNIKGIGHDT